MKKLLNKKLPGFSMVEVLFNMILITLVVSCGYLAYQYAFSDMVLFDKANAGMQEYVQFSNALTIDKEKSEVIIKKENGILFKKQNEDIVYELLPEKVLRKNGASADTFKVNVKTWKTFYDNAEVKAGLIERIEINIECNGKNFLSVLPKVYDTYTRMKFIENGN